MWLNLAGPCSDLSALEQLVESKRLQECRARKDIKPRNLIGPWRGLLGLEGKMAHLTEMKWIRNGREKNSGKGAVEEKIRWLKEARKRWQTGGGSGKELVSVLVKRLRGVTKNKACRRLRDWVEMKAAVKGTDGAMKMDWMGTQDEKQKRKDERWQSRGGVRDLGWWEQSRRKWGKNNYHVSFFAMIWEWIIAVVAEIGGNIISKSFLHLKFHTSVIGNHRKGQHWKLLSSLSWFSNTQLSQARAAERPAAAFLRITPLWHVWKIELPG